MNMTFQNTKGIYDELSKIIEGVQVRSLFSGYGFYFEEHMFGIYEQGIFYLRAESDLANSLVNKGACRPLKCTNHALSDNYYGVNQNIRTDEQYFQKIVKQSIKQIEQSKLLLQGKESEKIRNLPNLNCSHERLLSKIGINSVKELEGHSIEDVYTRLKSLGYIRSVNYYFNLKAAVARINIFLISEEEKRQQLEYLNRHLQSMNMPDEYMNK